MTDPTPDPIQPTPPAAQPTPYTAPAAAAPYAAAPGAARPTNVLSIIAIILGFVFPLGGVVAGFIALNQIKKTGENGHGLALAGIIVGFALIALGIIFSIIYFIAIAAAVSYNSTTY